MTESANHGTIGDEAVKLLDAVQDWARRNLGEGAHIATGAPECTWCPICQFIAVLRGDRPEISDKIAEATASMVAAVRAVVDAAAASPHGHPAEQPRVQRIDLGEGDA
ncbi:MAG TPA: hypothetical protein VE074_03115 [Jatrophihabitantaceae bacterium]|nr:hypothetical protein [Jatrophihabitantaceae bacterium]